VMTDGAESFQRRDGTFLLLETVLKELFAVKCFQGEFMTRRYVGFQRWCQKEGWQHTDDLAVAAIYLGDGT
jgi:hypothetical protein